MGFPQRISLHRWLPHRLARQLGYDQGVPYLTAAVISAEATSAFYVIDPPDRIYPTIDSVVLVERPRIGVLTGEMIDYWARSVAHWREFTRKPAEGVPVLDIFQGDPSLRLIPPSRLKSAAKKSASKRAVGKETGGIVDQGGKGKEKDVASKDKGKAVTVTMSKAHSRSP